ncbi:hypothetical protein CEP52_017385, partial [Fusarium oligoseptatum]
MTGLQPQRYASRLFAAESTTAAIQHLIEFHNIKRPSNSTIDDDDIDVNNAAEAFQIWVKDSMAARLPFIIELVQSAPSNINLSIDRWRARNRRNTLLFAHTSSTAKVILGFPRRYGGQTGDDLATL